MLDPAIQKFFAEAGRKGGKAKGKTKVRGGAEYYRKIQAIGEERKKEKKKLLEQLEGSLKQKPPALH